MNSNCRSTCVASVVLGIGLALAGRAQQKSPMAEVRQRDGELLFGEKQYDEADRAFREAWQLDPSDIRGLMGQVEVRAATGRLVEALHLLQSEVDKDPASSKLRMALGNTAVRAREYDLAIAVFQSAASGVENDTTASGELYLRIGETFRRKGDLQSAITNLRRSAELLPAKAVTLSTLALTLDSAGKKADAAHTYRELLELDPENGVALNNLASILSEFGDLNEALALGLHAQELMPNLDEVANTLGWIYLKLNQLENAISLFKEIVHKDPSNATYHYHFGMALAQKGDKTAALEQLNAVLECNPSEELAEKVRRLLESLSAQRI